MEQRQQVRHLSDNGSDRESVADNNLEIGTDSATARDLRLSLLTESASQVGSHQISGFAPRLAGDGKHIPRS